MSKNDIIINIRIVFFTAAKSKTLIIYTADYLEIFGKSAEFRSHELTRHENTSSIFRRSRIIRQRQRFITKSKISRQTKFFMRSPLALVSALQRDLLSVESKSNGGIPRQGPQGPGVLTVHGIHLFLYSAARNGYLLYPLFALTLSISACFHPFPTVWRFSCSLSRSV